MKIVKTRSRNQILIVDDHPMMRQSLAQLIDHEKDMVTLGEAATASQALNFIVARKPDLIIVDISLPDKSGLELIKDIKVFQPDLPVLVFSMHDEEIYAERVLRAGGRGYIMKQEGGKKLVQAIRHVLGGQIYVSEKVSSKILETLSGKRVDASDSPVRRLSDRDFEVFQMVGEGKGSREIAVALHLSVKTVEVHRSNIKRKLGFKHGIELVRYAIRWSEARGQTPAV
jgi:DNA-binding NarL/FixJ family response regulator